MASGKNWRMSTLWTIRLLGGLSAHRAGQETFRFQCRKTGSLLAQLAYHLNEDVDRDMLVESLWPHVNVIKGRHSLAQSLTSLRLQLEPPDVEERSVLRANHSIIRLNASAATTDLHRLKAVASRALRATEKEEQTALLRRVVFLYGGELLPGLYDDWVVVKRELVSAGYLGLLQRLIANLKSMGQTEEALEHALRSVAVAPDREELRVEAIKLLLALGRESEAIEHFQDYRERLLRIGETPGRATRQLMEPFAERVAIKRVRRGRPAKRRPPKQLNIEVVSEQSAVEATTVIPAPLTRFFGRESELARIESLLGIEEAARSEPLSSTSARLITIVGIGGCGKSRLAMEAGRKLQAAFDGHILFVPLSALTHAEDIPQAIVDALKLPKSGLACGVQIRQALRQHRWLLLLDNCEHLMPKVGRVVQSLLEDLPDLYVLATSRMPLKVNGEQVLTLAPLTVPHLVGAPKSLYEFPSVQMFVNRAQMVCGDFQVTERNAATISAIVERLEGIPLAIELAAARAGVLTPTQMLAALDDRFEMLVSRRTHDTRHRALRDAIDWSYTSLPVEAQQFFILLSIFRGGFTAQAAGEVCDEPNPLPVLEELVDRSLLVAEPGEEVMRFSMLESLRDYAREKTTPDVRTKIADRHAAYFLSWAEANVPELRTSARKTSLQRWDADAGNLLAAIEHVQGQSAEVRFVAAAWRYWDMRGYIEPGIRLLVRALHSGAGSLTERAEALHGLGVLRERQADMWGAEEALRESLELSNQISDTYGCARVLNSMALLMDKRGDYRAAQELSRECLELLRNCGDRWDLAGCLNTMGHQRYSIGELMEAEAYFEEARSLYEGLGDWDTAAALLNNLGSIASARGDYLKARTSFERSLALLRDLNRPAWIAYALCNLGDTLTQQGELMAAQRHLLECLDIRYRITDHSGVALALERLATIEHRIGDTMRAIHLIAAADILRKLFGTPLTPRALPKWKSELDKIRTGLSETDFQAAWAFGAALSLEAAVRYARENRLLPHSDQSRQEPDDLPDIILQSVLLS